MSSSAKSFLLVAAIFSMLTSWPDRSAAQGFSSLPSIKIGTAALITPAAANGHYGGNTVSSDGLAGLTGTETPTPLEIVQLARALKDDPDLIYQYVQNNIQMQWMYGLQKGALGTEIDKAGTPFDQAELMVALLRQAGLTANYVAGTIVLTQAQFAAWSGITDSLAACQLLSGGGIPATINGNTVSTTCASGFTLGTPVTSVRMAHVWVQVTISGSHAQGCSALDVCVFDPSYKNYAWKPGINLATATGFVSGDPLNAATTGYSTSCSTGSIPCVNKLNMGSLSTTLQGYASSLLTYIKNNNYSGSQIEDIVSGGVITPTSTAIRQAALPYADPSPPYTPWVWTPTSDPARYNAIPDQYRTKLETHGMVTHYNSDGSHDDNTTAFDTTFYADEIYGRKLSVTTDFHLFGIKTLTDYYVNNISLLFDGQTIATFANTMAAGSSPRGLPAHITLIATHPYAAAPDGTPSATGGYMNVTLDKPVVLTLPLSIVHGWGDTSRDLFTKWSNEQVHGTLLPHPLVPPLCHGGMDTCPPYYNQPTGDVEREKTGADYLSQVTRVAQLNAAIAHSTEQIHHVLGFVYADTQYLVEYNQGPLKNPDWSVTDSFDRVDIDMGMSLASKTAAASDRRSALQSIAAAASSVEGSIAAQLSDVPDVASTATRFEWANSPPADPNQNYWGLSPRNFYQFDSTNAPPASALQVEGTPNGHGNGTSPVGQQPSVGTNEAGSWTGALAYQIGNYTAQGFKVVAPEESFIGPGQRGGTIIPNTDGTYTHWETKQRGGALVATKYDTNGVDPVEIAHLQTGFMDENATFINTKGGGGSVQPDNETSYNPATAADILKSQFVDRSNALGVNIANGSMSYVSPASLSVGNGGFPYELSGTMTWHPSGMTSHNALESPIPPPNGWTTNWQNQLALSGSGFEAMGGSDIRDAVGAIVAFMSAQDIYKSTLTPAREVSAVLATAWWSDQIPGNTATVSVGAASRQFVRLPGNTWIQPGTGFATLVQHGTRAPYEYICPGPATYALSRGWDYSGVSFDVTNAGQDVQHFANWLNTYATSDIYTCGQLKGFRLTSWTFPQNVSISLSYGPVDPGGIDQLLQVKNSLNRIINFNSPGGVLSSFDNGLTGLDLRSVTINPATPGQLFSASMLDPNGKQTSFLYNETGAACPCRPTIFDDLSYVFTADNHDSSNLANANTEWDYDTLNRVYQLRDAIAIQMGTRNPYLFFVADGTRGERDDPLGQTYSVVYDTYGHPARYIDEMAHETDALFDSRGRATYYQYPEHDCEVFAYDDQNNQTDLWKVDTTSNCSTTAGASHVLHTNVVWDPTYNKPHLVTNARGYQTELDYFTSGTGQVSLLQQVKRPNIAEGTPIYTFDYDSMGRLLDATGPTAVVTHNNYSLDAFNYSSLTSTVVDYGSGHLQLTTSFGYDARGDVITTTDPRGFVTTSLFDNNRRKIEDDHHNGDANATLNAASRTQYDDVGRDMEDDAGTVFSGTMVTTWQMVKQTFYTPTSKVAHTTDADGRQINHYYDNADRPARIVDPVSRSTKFSYCTLGDPNCAANQIETEYRAWNTGSACSVSGTLQECYRRVTYLPDGEQRSVEDANNNITNYAYDGWVRLTKTTFPDSSYEQLTLDANGNVTQRTTRAGQNLNYQYNALDWITQKASPSSGVTDYWTYLLNGSIDTLCDVASCGTPGNIIDYGYDTAGRLNQVATRINGFGSNRTVNYTLDANGNRTKLAWPSQDAAYYVGYCYDNLNRMTVVTENATDCTTTKLATYQYDPLSRRTSVAYGNGASMSYPSYTNAGDLQTLAHNFTGSSNDNTYTYTYTNAHQLWTETSSLASWLWQPSTNGTNFYAAANVLNQYPSITFAGAFPTPLPLGYDANGNLTNGAINNNGGWTFVYDAENRLLTADKTASGTVHATYVYDPLGRRYKKSGTGVTTTYYLSDGTDEIAEYDSTKTVTTRYIPGPAIDEPIAVETTSTGAHEYFHTNHQGSVVAMSSDTGAMTEGPYIYDPYGNCYSGSSPCSSTGVAYRYTGQRFDPETSLYYYRARYYSASLGRFLQTDPVGYTADLNLYTYVGNDPTNGTDSTGMAGDDCSGGQGDKSTGTTLNGPDLSIDCHSTLISGSSGTKKTAHSIFGGGMAKSCTGGPGSMCHAPPKIAPDPNGFGMRALGIVIVALPLVFGQPEIDGIEAASAAEEAPELTSLFRAGGRNPANLATREGEEGLSTRSSLSNPLGSGGRPVFRPGDRYIEIDPRKLPEGSVIRDNVPFGHVTIKGVTPEEVQKAIIDTGKFPK